MVLPFRLWPKLFQRQNQSNFIQHELQNKIQHKHKKQRKKQHSTQVYNYRSCKLQQKKTFPFIKTNFINNLNKAMAI